MADVPAFLSNVLYLLALINPVSKVFILSVLSKQGSAADLIKVAMIRVHRRIQAENLALRMLLQVHDELVFETSAAEVEQHAKWIAEEMVNAIRFDVPLKVDTKFGPSWLSDK